MTINRILIAAATLVAATAGVAQAATASSRHDRHSAKSYRGAGVLHHRAHGAYAYAPRQRLYAPGQGYGGAETFSYGADRTDNRLGVGEPLNLDNPRDRQLQGTR